MKPLVLALAALFGAGAASAQTTPFGTPLAGTGPTVDFATLTASQVGNGDDWQFTLALADLGAVFGSANAYVGSLAVDAPGAEGLNVGSGLPLDIGVGGGVASVTVVNGGGPGGAFDFRIAFGDAADRLSGGESISFAWQDSGLTSITAFALHVQGLEGNTSGSSSAVWYAPTTPVPEPAPMALLAAGLGLLAVRRLRDRSR